MSYLIRAQTLTVSVRRATLCLLAIREACSRSRHCTGGFVHIKISIVPATDPELSDGQVTAIADQETLEIYCPPSLTSDVRDACAKLITFYCDRRAKLA